MVTVAGPLADAGEVVDEVREPLLDDHRVARAAFDVGDPLGAGGAALVDEAFNQQGDGVVVEGEAALLAVLRKKTRVQLVQSLGASTGTDAM